VTSVTIHAFCWARVTEPMFGDYALSTKALKEGNLCLVTLKNASSVDD
jgi:hypothetical protein